MNRDLWRVLSTALLAQLGISIVDQGLPTLTGYIKRDLHLSAATAGLAVSSIGFGKVLGTYRTGSLADNIGERSVLIAGSLGVGLLVALVAIAPAPLVFVLLGLTGIAGSAATPAGGRLVLARVPAAQRGFALSIRQTAIPLGGLVAAAVLPAVAGVATWRLSLLVAAALCVFCVLPLWRLTGPDARTSSPRSASGSSDRLIRRNLVLLTVWGCLIVTGQYVTLAFFALDLHQRDGISLGVGSLLLAVANAAGIGGRIAWGMWSDRVFAHGRKPLLLCVNVSCIAAAGLMFALPRRESTLSLVPVAFAIGFALIGYQGLFITMVAEAAGPNRVGASTGFSLTFVQLAIALTPPGFGLVADVTGTYRAAWAVLVGLFVLALVPATLIREADGG